VCVARRDGLSLILAPLATAPAVEGLAAERATGIGPGAAARHVEGATVPASSGSRRGPWCAESGLTTRGLEAGQVYPQ
jgi:hypothetical protein